MNNSTWGEVVELTLLVFLRTVFTGGREATLAQDAASSPGLCNTGWPTDANFSCYFFLE